MAFECLEAINGVAKQPWARAEVVNALALAKAVGGTVWLVRERTAIDRMLSTLRARGMV